MTMQRSAKQFLKGLYRQKLAAKRRLLERM